MVDFLYSQELEKEQEKEMTYLEKCLNLHYQVWRRLHPLYGRRWLGLK